MTQESISIPGNLAPVVLFVYNRPEHTRKTLAALSGNDLAEHSLLYIFADGPRDDDSEESLRNIHEVRTIIREKKSCGQIQIIERKKNLGIGESVIQAVTDIIHKHGKVIVLEDDLVTSPGFLKYMNDALSRYEKEENVMHISGYTLPLKGNLPETFFYHSAYCWGWGTWKRAWDLFNHSADDLMKKIDSSGRATEFTLNGLNYEGWLLSQNAKIERQCRQDNASPTRFIDWNWDICWSASVFVKNGLCLHPRISLVRNIGFDGTGIHCTKDWTSLLYLKQKIATGCSVQAIPLEENKTALEAIRNFFLELNNPPLSVAAKEKLYLVIRNLSRSLPFQQQKNAPISNSPVNQEVTQQLLFGIGGIERSGTTLLVAKLSSHPDVSVVDDDEIFLQFDCYRVIKNKEELNELLDHLIGYYYEIEHKWEFYYNYHELIRMHKDELLHTIRFPVLLIDLYPQLLKILSLKEKDRARYIGFKTANMLCNPYNFFALQSGYPSLKFIFIIRDPAIHCAALMHYHAISARQAVTLFFSYFNKAYESMMFQKEHFLVKYEDLVAAPEAMLREITAFLGLRDFSFSEEVAYRGRETYLGEKISKSKNKDRIESLNNEDRDYIYNATKDIRIRFGYLNTDTPTAKSFIAQNHSYYKKLKRKGWLLNLIKRNQRVKKIILAVRKHVFPKFNYWNI